MGLLNEDLAESWCAAKRWDIWWRDADPDVDWPEHGIPADPKVDAGEREKLRRMAVLEAVHDGTLPVFRHWVDDAADREAMVAAEWAGEITPNGLTWRLTPRGFKELTYHTIELRRLGVLS